ncbi:MAG: SDR family oxidoreductase [Deltaproteobacteria bacterium]|nr:SDR family oxidoreductase [Deltaproteobacteria bacterium]
MDLGIKDRVALVTGASRGIGRAIARALAKEGARVVLVARTREHLEVVRQEIETAGGKAVVVAVDLMAPTGVADLIETINLDVGAPEIMVHNLGGSFGIPALAPTADWQKVWQFNIGVGHEINRAFIPGMVTRKWGRIVHLSTLSTTTHNGYAPYVSAKCALDGYVKSVNREVSKENVIISGVAPGAIYSEGRFFAKMMKDDPTALERYYAEHLPIRRLGTADDVGPVVTFLCSEFAAFLAGSIVGVDGGGM